MKKKLLLSVAVLFSSMLGFAQNSLSMDAVKIAPGKTAQVSVNLNNSTAYTAFQFDMTLPKGITVKEATLADRASGHTLKTGTVNGKYRVLAYSYNAETNEGNKPITGSEGAIVNLTLEAGESVAEGATIVIDAGNQSQDGGQVFVEADGTTNYSMGEVTAAVTTSTSEKIEIPAGKMLAMVSDKDLDFTDLEVKDVKAYICTGYDVDTRTFWLTRVKDVPANTPILVKGDAGPYDVPITSSRTYYPQNFLLGDASATFDLDNSEGYINYVVSKSSGSIGSTTLTSLGAGKAYFHVPSSVTSAVAEGVQTFTLGKGKKLMCVSDYDLDFTSVTDVKAYVATGFDFDRTIWLSRVEKVSAGTPIILRGDEPEQKCEIPSAASKIAYVNMFKGNTSSEAVTLTAEMDGSTIYVMSKSTGIFGTIDGSLSMSKGKAWLTVPTAFINSIPAKSRGMEMGFMDEEAEVISIKAIGGEDDGTTAISRVASEAGNDTWYNLKGQRIDTPTKKGIYIKNGKKVIVK